MLTLGAPGHPTAASAIGRMSPCRVGKGLACVPRLSRLLESTSRQGCPGCSASVDRGSKSANTTIVSMATGDGSVQFAAVRGGSVYFTADSFASVFGAGDDLGKRQWSSIACSNDGEKGSAVAPPQGWAGLLWTVLWVCSEGAAGRAQQSSRHVGVLWARCHTLSPTSHS